MAKKGKIMAEISDLHEICGKIMTKSSQNISPKPL